MIIYYIVNRMNEYYINNLKKIQLYFLRILYMPYTKRSKIFLENKGINYLKHDFKIN